MTAIAIAYSTDGFVLAADGRRRMDGSRELMRDQSISDKDDAQKVYECLTDQGTLACTFLGETEYADRSFSVMSESMASKKVIHGPFSGLRSYAYALAGELDERIEKAHRNGVPYPKCQLCVCGYFIGIPEVSLITFHRERELGKPLFDVAMVNPHFGYNDLFGPELLKGPILNRTRGFEAFGPTLQQDCSMESAKDFVTLSIEACKSALAHLIDPQSIKNIGGHTHVATVTPSGFHWEIPPLNEVLTI